MLRHVSLSACNRLQDNENLLVMSRLESFTSLGVAVRYRSPLPFTTCTHIKLCSKHYITEFYLTVFLIFFIFDVRKLFFEIHKILSIRGLTHGVNIPRFLIL